MRTVRLTKDITIPYALRKRKGHKTYTLSVQSTGKIIVTVPRYVTIGMVERFLKGKSSWLQEVIKTVPEGRKEIDKNHYRKHKEASRVFIVKRLSELNSLHYNFSYKKVFVRANTSRWGSCSSLRNLNFDYRILFLPTYLQDYLLVHELCHLREMNHSKDFWELVEQAVPEYKTARKELRKHTL